MAKPGDEKKLIRGARKVMQQISPSMDDLRALVDSDRFTKVGMIQWVLGEDLKPTALGIASLLFWGIDDLTDAEMTEGVKPGELVRAETNRLKQ